MKNFFNITSILILLSLSIKGNQIRRIEPLRSNVFFEVITDTSMKFKPYLIIYEKGYYAGKPPVAERKRLYPKQLSKNSFVFDFKEQNQSAYFSLMIAPDVIYFRGMPDNAILNEYSFEPGDHIKMIIKPSKIPRQYDTDFSGKGSGKYRCMGEFRYDAQRDTAKFITDFNPDNTYNEKNQTTRAIERMLRLTNKYQSEMSSYSYNLINADFIGKVGQQLLTLLNSNLTTALVAKDTATFQKIERDFSAKFRFDYTKDIPDNILLDSKEYAGFLLQQIKYNYLIENKKQSLNGYYKSIKQIMNHSLRDRIILIFFKKYWTGMDEEFDEMLNDALTTIQDSKYKTALKEYERQKKGQKAFNFSLTNTKGERVSLNDFKGKVIFMDFWFTGCTFCKQYYKYVLSDVESIYKENSNVIFITVSIDKDKNQWLESVKGGEYTSENAVNLYTNGEGGQNEIIRFYNITSYPRPVIIGRDGHIIKFTGDGLRYKDRLIAEIDKALQSAKK